MKTIEINNTGVKANLSVFMFKEGDVFHAYCPELDLVGYDKTESGARKSFEWASNGYLRTISTIPLRMALSSKTSSIMDGVKVGLEKWQNQPPQ